jgi:Gas vesicle protein
VKPLINRPGPPGRATHAPVPRRRSRHTTVSRSRPPVLETKPPKPKPRQPTPKPIGRAPKSTAPKRQVARIFDDDATLVDLIDNLLSKGVMLNADLFLALANVDLVYIRLSALLCAADRVLRPRPRRLASDRVRHPARKPGH